MSDSLNVCTPSGRLGADAEVRYTNTGLAITQLSLAVKHGKRKANGDGYEDETYWIDVTMYGKRGESLQASLYKGALVAITGHIRSSSWEKDGKRYKKTEVVADNIELMTMQREQQQQASQAASVPQATPSPAYDPGLQATIDGYYAAQRPADVYDDEIPF
nr:MAG TPA: Single strand binding protein [Caudoviricetes sp.]